MSTLRRISHTVPLWAMALSSTVACGCSSRPSELAKSSKLTLQQSKDGGAGTLVANTHAFDAGQIELHRSESPCVRGISREMPFAAWMDAVAEACYPGSKREGPVQTVSISLTHPAFIELSANLSNSCWIAVVTRGSSSSFINFELVDSDDGKQQFGLLADERSVLPGDGPFCAISTRIRGVRASTPSDVSVSFQLAFYADVPSRIIAQ